MSYTASKIAGMNNGDHFIIFPDHNVALPCIGGTMCGSRTVEIDISLRKLSGSIFYDVCKANDEISIVVGTLKHRA